MTLLTNLQNYYKLDESSGNAVDQVSANNFPNSSAIYGTGKINGGTVNASLTSSSNIGISGTTARSINLWVKYTSSAGDGILGWGSNNTGEAFSILSVANHVWFGGFSQDVDGGVAINNGAWHMATVTYDGTTVNVYTDGGNKVSLARTLNTTNSFLFLGQRWDGTNQFTGSIDEVGVWTRCLTDSDVAQLYNNGNGLPYSYFAGIVYSVALDAGYYNLTGQSNSLNRTINAILATGSYALTGVDITITRARGYLFECATGFYNLTGKALASIFHTYHTSWIAKVVSSVSWGIKTVTPKSWTAKTITPTSWDNKTNGQ